MLIAYSQPRSLRSRHIHDLLLLCQSSVLRNKRLPSCAHTARSLHSPDRRPRFHHHTVTQYRVHTHALSLSPYRVCVCVCGSTCSSQSAQCKLINYVTLRIYLCRGTAPLPIVPPAVALVASSPPGLSLALRTTSFLSDRSGGCGVTVRYDRTQSLGTQLVGGLDFSSSDSRKAISSLIERR